MTNTYHIRKIVRLEISIKAENGQHALDKAAALPDEEWYPDADLETVIYIYKESEEDRELL